MDLEGEPMDTQGTEFLDSQTATAPPSLVFNESLVGSPRALKVGELTARLQTLHSLLKELEQNVDKESLETVTKELVHKQVINSTNKTVKALTACCLADIIRLHAPTCPYEVNQVKMIFRFFVEQLSFFSTADSPDFQYHFYLLENLQSVKTFLVLNEIDCADEIVLPMVDEFFKCAAKANLARNVELCMTDVLIQLIEDVGLLGPELTELILDQFDKFEKGSSNPAYLMALDICYACPNMLQRKVCQYFTDILLSLSNGVSGENASEEFQDLQKAHNLIVKINAVSPDLLLNVLPLLQEELKLDQSNVRQLATETLAKMFADPTSTVIEKYPNIWRDWLGRHEDKVAQLRVRWVELCVDIYRNHHEVGKELADVFQAKLADPDDKVRLAACKALGDIKMESDLTTLDKNLLTVVAERFKDKKPLVRWEAMKVLGVIYNTFFERIQEGDKLAIQKVGWIPDTLLNCLYVGQLAVTTCLEKTLNQYIFPENENDLERTERLITVVESLSDKQRLAFTALARKQKATNENVRAYLKICQKKIDNATQSDHEVSKSDDFIKYLAAFFPDRARTLNALRSFLNAENENDLKLLRTCIDLDADYKRVFSAKKKLLNNLREEQSAIVEIFESLLNRACPFIINKNNVPHLLIISKKHSNRRSAVPSPRAVVAQDLLKEVSATYPTMYTAYMKDIVDDIMNDTGADDSLVLLAEVSKAKGKMNFKADLKERLMSYVANGSVHQAELAAAALGNMKNAQKELAELASNLCDELLLDASNLLTNLTSLAQFALYRAPIITPSIDSVIRFVEHGLLQAPTTEYVHENEEWVPYDDLPSLSQKKITGVRLLVNYLLACKETNDPEEYVVSKIFNILWNLLDRTCESAIADKTNAAETSHLRLAATQAIVSLTNHVKYQPELSVTKFERLSVTLQDTCFYVRQSFAESLIKGLQTEAIHSRYYALLFVCAHEPESALLKQVKSFIQKRLKNMEVKQGESTVLDSSLVRLIHLLAHHSDFSVAVDDLNIFAQYIRFFLSCVATADNVSFLYHIVQKIKLSKDMVSTDLSQNSYILSDLACLLINNKCKEASWPLVAYEGEVTLQSKLYRTLPSGTIQHETIKKSYLPSEFVKQLQEEQHHKSGEKRSRSTVTVTSKRLKV